LIGKNFKNFNFYADSTTANIANRETLVKNGKEPDIRDILLHKKDGSEFWARSQIIFVKLKEEDYIQAIIQDVTEEKLTQLKLNESEYHLQERIKELNCLYELSKIAIKPHITFEEIIRDSLRLIPPAWQFPESTSARIIFESKQYCTENFKESDWFLKTQIEINRKPMQIEVYYSDDREFISEEKDILTDIGLRIKEILEKRESEVAFELEKNFTDDIMNSSMDTIFVFNPESGKAIRWNKVFREVSGYTDEEISKLKAPDSYYNTEELKHASEAIQEVITKGTVTLELSLISKEGQKIPYEYTGTKLEDSEGNILIVAVGRNLTERKEVQEKLKESEAKFRGFFETIPDLFFLISSDGTILEYRGTSEELYVPPNEFLGKKMGDVLPENVAELNVDSIKNTLKTRLPQIIEYNLEINGRSHFYEARHLYFSEDRVLVFIRDITERRMAEEHLQISERKYREAYDRANFYKDLFSHDINNILQVVNSSAELISYQLGDSEKSKDITNIAEIIKKQVDRGSKLVSNVRTLSKLDEEKIPTKIIEISRFLENSIEFVQKAYKNRHVEIEIEGLKGKLIIKGNELIQDVFENILINSIKYNENSNIEIIIKLSNIEIDNLNYYKFEFFDNGIGIPDDRKEAIFLSGNREFKGSKGMGLGLSLVSKIIQVFNGKIWVEDKVKGDFTQGSNFILLLPKG
jgi:PAS domain S-box-containing protein